MTKDIGIYAWRILIYYIRYGKLDTCYRIIDHFKKGNHEEYTLAIKKLVDEKVFNKELELNEKYEFLESDIVKIVVENYENDILNGLDKEEFITEDSNINYDLFPEKLIETIMDFMLTKLDRDKPGLVEQFFKDKNNRRLFIRTIRNNPELIRTLRYKYHYPLDKVINNIQKLNM